MSYSLRELTNLNITFLADVVSDGSTNYFSGKIQNTFKSPSPSDHQLESLKGRGREAIAMKQTFLPKTFKVKLCPTQSIRHWQVR